MCLLSSKWWTSDVKGELIIKQAEMSAFFDGCDRQKCSQNQKKKKLPGLWLYHLLSIVQNEPKPLFTNEFAL